MEYVLLLRGINVGGKNKVEMSPLKLYLQDMGLTNVSSYINSGNLFFESNEPIDRLHTLIDQLLKTHYTFGIPFSLLSKSQLEQEVDHLPQWWKEDYARKDVLFYTKDVDKTEVQSFIQHTELRFEKAYCGDLATFWVKEDERSFLKTAYHKELLKAPFYRLVTIRNGRTFDYILDKLGISYQG